MEKQVKFTEEELFWIEEQADIECALIFKNFYALLNPNINPGTPEAWMRDTMISEMIKSYPILQSIRAKLSDRRNPIRSVFL